METQTNNLLVILRVLYQFRHLLINAHKFQGNILKRLCAHKLILGMHEQQINCYRLSFGLLLQQSGMCMMPLQKGFIPFVNERCRRFHFSIPGLMNSLNIRAAG